MSKARIFTAVLSALAMLNALGCGIPQHRAQFDIEMLKYGDLVEATGEIQSELEIDRGEELILSPSTFADSKTKITEISLETAIREALTNSKVLRDLGGRLVQAPQTSRTIMDPAIRETDPLSGIEGALSEFDARWSNSLFFEKNDRGINSTIHPNQVLQQDLLNFQTKIAKTNAFGTTYSLGNNIGYEKNNSLQQVWKSNWSADIQAEIRQPLLQGRGVPFNRVAGPNSTIGDINGIVIARVNTSISQLDFELGIRDLVNNVENAYWDLYFAYRLYESRKKSRDAALDTFTKINSRSDVDKDAKDQASEQYWYFEDELLAAQTGRVIDGTRSNNGSTGGTFQGNIGIQVAERRLRLLIGRKINSVDTIRPNQDPTIAGVKFNWNAISQEALRNRSEIRRQKLFVKHAGLEVAATYNFLLPRVDLIGGYRWRGFGGNDPEFGNPNPQFDNVFRNLASGDFQEIFLGAEAALPVGFRQAHSALQNAKLKQSRQNAILDELKRQIVYDLSNAYASVDRTFKQTQINYNRLKAAQDRSASIQSKRDDTPSGIDLMLDAERRQAEAEIEFFRSIVSYVVAIKNVHLEKGSLLQYNNIFLSDFGISTDPILNGELGVESPPSPEKTIEKFERETPNPPTQASDNKPADKKFSLPSDSFTPDLTNPAPKKDNAATLPSLKSEIEVSPVFKTLTNPK
ncbi:TolC family protein [Mariniblastus sp.]|nr:TolC family protein [Mariniblastus sp.]